MTWSEARTILTRARCPPELKKWVIEFTYQLEGRGIPGPLRIWIHPRINESVNIRITRSEGWQFTYIGLVSIWHCDRNSIHDLDANLLETWNEMGTSVFQRKSIPDQ